MPVSVIKRLCVFCGSSPGKNPAYAAVATAFGKLLAQRGITLVYGGGGTGLMGVVADAVLAARGQVVGVIPFALRTKELAHAGVTEMHVVATMHERKSLMADLADCFVALPGGIGTLDEFCEIFTWLQLGIHHKPCGILNVGGYFDGFVSFLDHAVEEGFIKPEFRRPLLISSDPSQMLDLCTGWMPPETMRWVTPSQR